MLSEREKHGISELLDRMPTRDLMSLAQTVTSRPVMPESSVEAINAIIQHTEKPQDLLRKRKVKKDFLAKYLTLKRVHVEAADAKENVIQAVCQLWGSSGQQQAGPAAPSSEEDSLPEAPAPSRNTSYTSLNSLDLGGASSLLRGVLGRLPVNDPQPGGPPSPLRDSFAMDDDYDVMIGGCDDCDDEDDQLPPLHPIPGVAGRGDMRLSQSLTPTFGGSSSFQPSFPIQFPSALRGSSSSSQPQPTLLSSSAPSSYFYHSQHLPNPLSSASSMSPASSGSSPTSGVSSTAAAAAAAVAAAVTPSSEVATMADSFVKWYYELLNATFLGDNGDFGPQHFWADASARITLSPSHPAKEAGESICVQGDGRQVCDALKHVVRKYRVTYHPVDGGVSGCVDGQGQAVLQAAGTLLTPADHAVCGSFQQQFGLVRDPSLGNNWKIKFTNASLVSKPETTQAGHGSNSQFQAPASFDQSSGSATAPSAMALS